MVYHIFVINKLGIDYKLNNYYAFKTFNVIYPNSLLYCTGTIIPVNPT